MLKRFLLPLGVFGIFSFIFIVVLFQFPLVTFFWTIVTACIASLLLMKILKNNPSFLKMIHLSAFSLFSTSLIFLAILQAANILGSSMSFAPFLYYGIFTLVFTSLFGLEGKLHLSLPFIQDQNKKNEDRKVILFPTVLDDERTIDFFNCGILHHRIFILDSFVREMEQDLTSSDELRKSRAKKRMQTLHSLYQISGLGLQELQSSYPTDMSMSQKHVHICREENYDLLVSDLLDVQSIQTHGVHFISLNLIANSLKPLLSTGKSLSIKVQRIGKEPRQGIGYLDDGSMVVINDGAEQVGEFVDVSVISVKHSSSGRIIFTNLLGNEEPSLLTSLQEEY